MADNYNNQIYSLFEGSFRIEDVPEDLIQVLIDKFPFSPFGHLVNYLFAESKNLPNSQKLVNKAATYSPDRVQMQSILKKSFSTGLKGNEKPENEIPSEARNFDLDKDLFEFDFNFQKKKQATKIDEELEPKTSEDDGNLSPYVQWLQSLKPMNQIDEEDQLDQLMDDFKIAPQEIEFTQVAAVIEPKQSDFFGEVITETLAEVLANQGQFDKAIVMYEKLSLIFPEKSAFFAARIKNLKNS